MLWHLEILKIQATFTTQIDPQNFRKTGRKQESEKKKQKHGLHNHNIPQGSSSEAEDRDTNKFCGRN